MSLLPWFIIIHKQSCGKVMFSQVYVKNSIHGGLYPGMH